MTDNPKAKEFLDKLFPVVTIQGVDYRTSPHAQAVKKHAQENGWTREQDGWNFKPSPHRSKRLHKKLLKRFGTPWHLAATQNQAAESRWQSIETAPRDGNTFIAYEQYGSEAITVCWSPLNKCFISCWDGARVVNYVCDQTGTDYKDPSDLKWWMPLPAPPQAASKIKGGE